MRDYAQLMLDATPMCCILWDRDLRVFACSEEAVRVFGVSSKQEFCDRFFEFSPEYQPCGKSSVVYARELIGKAFDEGYQRFEWIHLKPGGELMPAEVTVVRLEHDGGYVVGGYIRDLTEHNRMLEEINTAADDLRLTRDAAESANQAKSSFLANMSHEMRTPLNVIVGLTSLHLEELGVSAATRADIKKINNAGSILLGIVNDVLDISKIEAGKLRLSPERYDTASLFNDIITLNIIRIESKPIAFNIEIDEQIPREMCGDELRIKQIFNNLLSNAFKYTNEGSVTLSLSCEREDDSNIWMSISVSDTGIGIKQESMSQLFADYYQVDTKATRKIEGTGLGLSITKKMVELMGGEISVESEFGKGTTFSARIRQTYISDAPLGRETVEKLRSFRYTDNKLHVSETLVRIDMSYARVLVVDDYQTNLDVALGMLRKYKMQVDCVTSGQEAINRMKRGAPVYDAIFMDHMMPEMDGIEATKRIRALDTEYAKKVPIISLTANAVTGNEQMFLDSGFQAFLSKPVDMLQLDAALKKWVRDKSREAPAIVGAVSPATDNGQSIQSIEIAGINVNKAMAICGNDEEMYLHILRSFAANTPAIIDKLRQVTQESLSAYEINVHGLKGSSSNIGAERVREQAEHMEIAAKARNLGEVLAGNEAMLLDTAVLVTAIKTWLKKQDAEQKRPQLQEPDPALLISLRLFCEQYDMLEVDAILEQLESASYDTDNDLIVWLREKVDNSDFEAITERINQRLLKE